MSERGTQVDDEPSFDKVQIDQDLARSILYLWKIRALHAARSHYHETVRLQNYGTIVTIFNSIGGIAVTCFSVASLLSSAYEIYVSSFSIFAGFIVLSSSIAQFLLRFDEEARMHKNAANEFSNIQRKIERYTISTEIKMGTIHNINRDINFVSKTFPMVAPRSWQKNEETVNKIHMLEEEVERLLHRRTAATQSAHGSKL